MSVNFVTLLKEKNTLKLSYFTAYIYILTKYTICFGLQTLLAVLQGIDVTNKEILAGPSSLKDALSDSSVIKYFDNCFILSRRQSHRTFTLSDYTFYSNTIRAVDKDERAL
ncbi:hypothetical protein AB4K20DRAFT_1865722 [Rhizopus microsporus]